MEVGLLGAYNYNLEVLAYQEAVVEFLYLYIHKISVEVHLEAVADLLVES